MKITLKAVTALIIGALAMMSVFTPVAGQSAIGTVNVQVVYCPQLEMAAQLPGVPAEFCSPGPGLFSFYLIGDGTADFELLNVPLSGTASIELPVGEYEVYEENTFVKMIVFVEADQTSSIVFGIPSEAGPETPSGDLYISAWACPGATEVAFADVVAADCVRIATDLSFYLIGDGTDAYYHVPTMTTGAILTSLPLGDYELVAEATQTHLFLTVGEGSRDVHIVFPKAADPVTPAPSGEFYISAWECPGVTEVAFTDAVGADCVRIATDLSFYLIGDGTATYYHVPTLATGAMLVGLPIGDYEVVHEASQTHLFMSVSNDTGDVHLVVPKAADPVAPTPVATKAPAAPAAPKPTAAAVTKLPSTGSGPDANIAALGTMVAGAVLVAGTIGLRMRKN